MKEYSHYPFEGNIKVPKTVLRRFVEIRREERGLGTSSDRPEVTLDEVIAKSTPLGDGWRMSGPIVFKLEPGQNSLLMKDIRRRVKVSNHASKRFRERFPALYQDDQALYTAIYLGKNLSRDEKQKLKFTGVKKIDVVVADIGEDDNPVFIINRKDNRIVTVLFFSWMEENEVADEILEALNAA